MKGLMQTEGLTMVPKAAPSGLALMGLIILLDLDLKNLAEGIGYGRTRTAAVAPAEGLRQVSTRGELTFMIVREEETIKVILESHSGRLTATKDIDYRVRIGGSVWSGH